MKTYSKIKYILFFIFCFINLTGYSQVDVDKKINMTGATSDDRRITGVGDVTLAADAVSAQVLQKGALVYVPAVGGTPNAITATTSPSFIPQAGSVISFKVSANNTAAVTLNVNGSGASNVYKNNNAPLIANELKAGQVITVVYDGTDWEMVGADNLGNHQATQDITTSGNDAHDIGSSTNSFKNIYLGSDVKIDGATFVSNGGSTNTLLGETQNTTNTANDNTFVGYQAGKNNDSGYSNLFSGYSSGLNNTSGAYNVFLGYLTGSANTTGNFNTFVGTYAGGIFSTVSSYNTAMGFQAGLNMVSGEYNTIMGNAASYYNITGSYNTALGNRAGYNANAFHNTFIGHQSGYNTTTGYNTIIGSNAGYSNETGASNCYVGVEAGYNNTNSDNVAVGAYANYLGNVTSGVFVGWGADAADGLMNVVAIGRGAYVSSSNTIVLGNGLITRIGIGVTPGLANIMEFAATTARLTTGGVWTNASDRNIKENIVQVDGREILMKLKNLPITSWNYKKESKNIQHIGPMAQDFYKIFQLGNDSTTISTIDPSGIALAAIQELDRKDKELEEKVKEIASLKSRLEANEKKMDILAEELHELKAFISKSRGEDKQASK